MAKSAKEHLQSDKQPKMVVLEKDFAGAKKGQKMFVATPKIVDEYIKKIPYGETRTIERMRTELAQRRKAHATCPMSTSIFIRISAESAIEDLENGQSLTEVTPFWRLLTSTDKITKRLAIDPAWVDHQREQEQSEV